MASGEPPHQADAEQEALEATDDPTRPNPWVTFAEEAGKRLEPNLRSGEAMCHEVNAHGDLVGDLGLKIGVSLRVGESYQR